MDNLEKALIALFRRVPVKKIITEELSSGHIACTDFVRLMRNDFECYSETELKNLYYYLTCNFVDEFHGVECGRGEKEKLDIFELLRNYAEWILTEQDGEVVCEYSRFLHWRRITEALSEDLFTTSFMASNERKNASMSINLNWKATITHNNWELHKILDQGMAENHSHLKGGSPVFQLTWISLMNNLYLNEEYGEIDRIENNRRNIDQNIFPIFQEETMSLQLLQAACIRYILFRMLRFVLYNEVFPKELSRYCSEIKNPLHMYAIKKKLSIMIATAQNIFPGKTFPDYAIAGIMEENKDSNQRTVVFQGERWLLYHFFSAIFTKTQLSKYRDLFYAYLVIKEKFRAEFIQNNQNVGFENFRIYEGRKDVFLENSFFKKELVKKAFEASFAESKVAIFEARIGPKKSAREYCKYIREMDAWLPDQRVYQYRFFYVIHFIKKTDYTTNYEYMTYRHRKNRMAYKEQALHLAQFREEFPYEAKRIRGIDAANTEIGCGPEVFAQIFRYLSDHMVFSKMELEQKMPQLRKTYHVGEDFLDLPSGLRAIDEAIHFLGMKCGDRLGHAIAMGIDVKEWYQSKNNRILLTQQEYLDNIAWMYHLGVSCHVDDKENVLNFLREEFEYYFQMIYRNAMDQKVLENINRKAQKYYKGTEWEKYYNRRTYEFSIENYYSAWELRGDDPELYRDGFFANKNVVGYRYKSFSYYSVNRSFPEKQNKRYLPEVALLYYYYHYDGDVRKEGEKIIEKKVDITYVRYVQMIQCELQRLVGRCGIGIETNPSSNVLISTFRRYDKHPILNFYNMGLTENVEKVKQCPQLNVSINTDNAGIFSTSLENEYAYMALALENVKDEQGKPLYKKRNIYEWLNNVRVMGVCQAFLGEEEMKRALREWNDGRKSEGGTKAWFI